jgi:hypothetical protein
MLWHRLHEPATHWKDANMIKHTGPALVAGLLLASPAMGAPPKESGFYIGGAIGAAEFDDDGAFAGLQFDDSDVSVTLFAGYRFMRHFALEGRAGNLGSYTVCTGFPCETLEIRLASVHAVGIAPLGQHGWELYGQIGLGQVYFSCRHCGDAGIGSAGIGLRYAPVRQLTVGLQFDVYAWEEGPDEPSVATAQLALQYSF